MHTAWRRERFREQRDPFFSIFFCSIRRPYITFKLPCRDKYTPLRLCNLPDHRRLGCVTSAHLEWPVWSSSSGNNCHAVHRSLSSGASFFLQHSENFYLVSYCKPSCILHKGWSKYSSWSCWIPFVVWPGRDISRELNHLWILSWCHIDYISFGSFCQVLWHRANIRYTGIKKWGVLLPAAAASRNRHKCWQKKILEGQTNISNSWFSQVKKNRRKTTSKLSAEFNFNIQYLLWLLREDFFLLGLRNICRLRNLIEKEK